MLRVIRSELDMTAALRERRLALHLSQEEAEHAVGLTRAHLGKVENGHRPWGKRVFRMTPTLEWLLEYYGASLIFIDAPAEKVLELQRMGAQTLLQLVGTKRPGRAGRCPNTLDMFESDPAPGLAA